MVISCCLLSNGVYLSKWQSPVSVESSHQIKVILISFDKGRGGEGKKKSVYSMLRRGFFEKLFTLSSKWKHTDGCFSLLPCRFMLRTVHVELF